MRKDPASLKVFTPDHAEEHPFFQGMTQIGLPWNQPVDSLIKKHPPEFVIAVGSIVEVETKPFFEHLLQSMHFPYELDYLPDEWPRSFQAYIRVSDDSEESLSYTVAKLGELFGEGKKSETDNEIRYSKDVTWDFGGWGRIYAEYVHYKKGSGVPDAYIELNKSCWVSFDQYYFHPATAAEEEAISSARVVFTPVNAVIVQQDEYLRNYTRQSVKRDLPENTIMLSADNKYLLIPQACGFVKFFPFRKEHLQYSLHIGEPRNYNAWQLRLAVPLHYRTQRKGPENLSFFLASQIEDGHNEVGALYETLRGL